MSNLRKSIRHKRFLVKTAANIRLIVETNMAETLDLQVIDCSANGLLCKVAGSKEAVASLELNSILSSSRLEWDDKNCSLGRLVVRRINDAENETTVGFSTVDVAVPVTSSLSKHLDVDFGKEHAIDEKELSADKFSLAHFVENEYTNVDLFERMREFSYFHRSWVESKKYAYQNVRMPSFGPRVNLARPRKNGRKDYLVMGSNDYFGLGSHPEVREAAKQAIDQYGFGSSGSPVTTGVTALHADLCEKIAKIHQKEAAILFNSGYVANIGIITSVCTTSDLIVADQLCHASIQDGMSMSRATSRFFKHNSVEHLEMILEKERSNFNGCLVITEGVFSMDGDTAPLDKIYEVARRYNCRIMVDQAHCFGILGPSGLGLCDKFGLLRETDIIMGTFSKVCGSIGGFATGSQALIDWLRSFSRAQIFSVSLPPCNVAATAKALDLFIGKSDLVTSLKSNVAHFVKALTDLGFPINPNHESAVVPIVISDESKMGEIYQSLLDDGVWCIPIVYPAVSRKNCRFRFTVMATHTKSDLDYAALCVEKALMKADFKHSARQAATRGQSGHLPSEATKAASTANSETKSRKDPAA